MADQSPFTSAILLAAGVSRRMGTLKALLDWQGRSLIIHQIVSLREAGVDEVIVVLGHRSDELQARIGVNRDVYNLGRVRCVTNEDYAQGKTTSIKTGLFALGPSADPDAAILMLNVDQPRSTGIVRQTLAAHHHSDGNLITIPTYQGKGGHPIVVSRRLFGELVAIDERTEGMRAVTDRHRDATQRVELGAPELLWDVNTPEQYQAALKELAAGLADLTAPGAARGGRKTKPEPDKQSRLRLLVFRSSRRQGCDGLTGLDPVSGRPASSCHRGSADRALTGEMPAMVQLDQRNHF